MFGTLTKVYKKDWYTNPENLIISFDTIYESMNFEIFSIYKVPKTTDYLKTYFADDEEFSDYVKMIKDRSIKDFEIDVNPGDKILTLSTCTGENQRLVVHAKLIV
jgi:sortase B